MAFSLFGKRKSNETGLNESGLNEAGPNEAGPNEAGPNEAGQSNLGTDEAPEALAEQRSELLAAAGPADDDSPVPRRGFFDRMRAAVTRTRENFSASLAEVVALTREVDETTLQNLEPLLLAADVGSATSAIVLENLRQRALRKGVEGGGIEGGAQLKTLLKAELQHVLDNPGGQPPPRIQHPAQGPEVIMMVGVNGTGKTTTTGKLAAHFVAQHRSVLLCAADTFRAAAIEQLEVWSQRSGVPVIKTRQGGDPSAALYDACASAKARNSDILIVDTAGRLHTKTDLMKELDKMRRTAEKLIPGAPHQVLLVMDATTGQNGLTQARLFTESARVTGIVLTKLDGTAKGGIVLAIATELGLPVVYAGTGEKLEDLIPFDSKSFIDSLID
jgi:fused signal recognition particle receptor